MRPFRPQNVPIPNASVPLVPLPDLDRRTARNCFWTATLLFAAFWTVAPAWVIPNFRPDLLEMLAVGQNWVLATQKHGSLTCWLIEIIYRLCGRADWSAYLTAQLCVVASLFGLWTFGQRLLSRRDALLAALAMLSFYFFHFESTLYNNHTTLAVFWIYSVLFLHRAIQGERLVDWALTGVFLGLGLYAKLTVFLLIFSMLLYAVLDPKARRLLKTPGPYLTAAIALAIFLPFFLWIVQHDFVNLRYANESATAKASRSALAFLLAPAAFLGSQALYAAPIFLPILPAIEKRRRIREKNAFKSGDGLFLTVLFWTPFLIQLLLCAVSGSKMRGALGCHLWYFFPIYILFLFQTTNEPRRMRRAFHLALILPVIIMILFVVGIWLSPAITGRGSRYHFPGRAVAETADRLWRENADGPPPFARGDWWLSLNASVYGPERPRFWDPIWATEDDFARQGGIWLWPDGAEDAEDLRKEIERRFPNAVFSEPLTFPKQTRFDVPPAVVRFAVVPPAPPKGENR